MTIREFITQFTDYIKSNGGNPSEWYSGITSDPEDRIFEKHNVNKSKDLYIYDDAEIEVYARTIEKYLVEKIGMKGVPHDGDLDTTWVYAYKITPETNQNFS